MRQNRIAAALAAVLAAASLPVYAGAAPEAETPLTEVTLNEVAHSIFYAPQYVAIELGYFEEEGIALTVVNGFGAIIKVQNEPFISSKKDCLLAIPLLYSF